MKHITKRNWGQAAIIFGKVAFIWLCLAMTGLITPQTTKAQSVLGLAPVQYWWCGPSGGNFGTASNWSTNGGLLNLATSLLANLTDQNDVMLFNFPSSNNVASTVTVNLLESFGGIIVNNTNSTKLTGGLVNLVCTLNGFTNADNSGKICGLVINPGCGSLIIGAVGGILPIPLSVAGSQYWINNGTGILAISNTVSLSAGANLTLSGTTNIYFNDVISGAAAITNASSATTYFAGNNTFSQGLNIQSGTVALVKAGSIGTASLTLGIGATLDVSAVTNFTLPAPNPLCCSGLGTILGSTAAAIKCATNGIINVKGCPIVLTCNDSQSPTNPALYIPQGTLSLSNNLFVINTLSGKPLTNGLYVLAQLGAGASINTNGVNAYVLAGTALSLGGNNQLLVSSNLITLSIGNASTTPAPITPSGGTSYYYRGLTNGSFNAAFTFHWSTTDSPTGTQTPFVFLANNVAIFNISASNAVNQTVDFGNIITSYGGMIFNNTGTTKIINFSGALAAARGPAGFTNGTTSYYGYVVNPGAGAVTLGSGTNESSFLDYDNSSPGGAAQTWLNNSTSLMTINAAQQSAYSGSAMLTLGGSGNILMNGVLSQQSSASPLGLAHSGTGTLFLNASNSYGSGTTIQGGTVALTNSGTLGSGTVAIAAGGTLDVSGLTANTFTLGSSQALAASGTGTIAGSTAATIKGKSGGTVNLANQKVTLNFDGANPALYVAQGTLALSNNLFIVNTTSGSPLTTNKTYVLAQQASGNISVTGSNFTATGSAFIPGYTYAISVTNNQVLLSLGFSYWNANGTNWQSTTNWSTQASSATPNPTAIPGIYDIPTFNITPSNNIAQNIALNGNVSVAGLVFNNSNSTAITGGTNAYSLTTAGTGITINAGGGSVTLGSASSSQAVTNFASTNQTWLNNGSGTLSLLNNLQATSSNTVTLTLAGSGAFNLTGNIVTNSAATGTLALDYTGTSTVTLGASNSFKGGITVEQGSLLTTPAVNATTLNSAFGGNATVNLGNASTNPTAAARIRLSTGTYTNGIALSSAMSGTLTLSVVSSNSAVVTGGVTGANNLTLFAGTNSTLNFTGLPLNFAGALTASGNVGATSSALLLSSALSANVTSVTVLSNAPGAPLVLAGTNLYTGTTTIGGTLMLTNNGSIAASTNIVLSAGATLDVGGLASAFTLGINQVLNVGSGTGIIKGNANVTAGKLALTYTNGVAALLVTNGSLTLSANAVVTLNNASVAALPVGKYLVIATTGGLSGSLPSITVTGTGIVGTGVPILQISNGNLYLVVAGQPTTTALTVTLPVGTNLNLAVANLATNWTDPNGTNVNLQSIGALSTRGFAVATNAGFITYVPTSAGTDTVSYVVVDGYGMTNTGVITAIARNTTPVPFFTPGSGGYLSPQTVTLTNAEPGSTIFFITNGVTNVYAGAFTLPLSTNNFVVTTWATAPNEFISSLNSATYGTIVTPIWSNPAGGSWTNGVNWSNNVVGNAVDVTLDFSQLALLANATVTVDGAISAGTLVFGDQNGTNGWFITPGSSGGLTLDDGTNAPVINVVNAATTISAPITSVDGLVKTGAGTLTLAGANTLTGSMVVSNGTLALANAHAMDGSTNLIIPEGSTVDVSALTNFTLPAGQTLTALGAGTGIGTTAATLTGAAGGTINLGANAINLTFDGSDPALYVSRGLLILNNNPFTINAGPLNDGSYVIATSADGITGTGPFSVTGLANGATGVITIVGNQLVLTVTNPNLTYPGGTDPLPGGNTAANGLAFNDPSGTTLTGGANSAVSLGNGGINVASGSGPVTIGDANGNPALNLVSSQDWTNNSPAVVTVNGPVTNGTTSPITVTIVGINGFDLNSVVADGNAPLTLVHDDTGTTTLNPSNNFSGGVFVQQGTVASANAASAANQNNAFGSNPWITLGDDQPDTNSAALSLGTGVLTNDIVLAAGSTGDLIVGVQSNANATVTGGIIGTNNVILSGAAGGTLTFTNGSINNLGTVTVAGNGPVIVSSPIDTNVMAVTVEPSLTGGTNKLVLNGANTYTGTTTVGGTLALGATGSIADSTNIVINQGGIFDVSAQSSFALQLGQTLTALGAGTGVGTTAATIIGAAGGTVNLGSSPIILNYDGSNPALYVAQGTLVLNNNPFTINAGLLNDGSYVIATSASAITGTGPFSVTGLANGAMGVITVVGNQVILTVTNIVTLYPGGPNPLPNGTTPVNGAVFDDPSGTTLTGTPTSTVSIGGSGINVLPGSGPVVIGNANGNPSVDLIGSQSWTNNSPTVVTVNSPVTNGTASPITLTLGGTNGFDLNGVVADGNGPLSLVHDNTGTTTLNPSNSFSGGAFVEQGTVASANAASATSQNHAFGSNPWVTLGDDQPDTNSAALSLGTGVLTNGIVLASGSTGNLIVGVQSNANATVTGGLIGTNDVILSGAPGGTLTFTNGPINNHGSVTVTGNPANGATGPVNINSPIETNVTAVTVEASPTGGTNTLTLNSANTYTGTTTVGGTLVLGATGSIFDSTNIVIEAGGIFDVSAQSSFTLLPSQTLTALGAGTGIGTTAATIIGAFGGTVNLNSSPIILAYDGSDPSLYVAHGQLVLNNNPFTIFAGPLNDGTYVVATSVDGILGTGSFSVTGLANGATGAVTIVGNQLVLTVTNLTITYPGGNNSLPNGTTPANGVVFNDPAGTTLTGDTNSTLSIGGGGINVVPGTGPVVIGDTNGNPAVDLIGSQSWTNNSAAPVTVNSPVSNQTTNPATLTLSGTNGFDLSGLVTDGNGPLTLVHDDTGTTTLNPSNDFSGGVFVEQGTVASSDAASATNQNNAFGSNPWLTLGDDQPDTNSAALSLGTGVLTNGIVLAAGSTGDLIVGVQSNAEATVTGGIIGTNNVTLSGAAGGTLTFVDGPINNNGSVTVAGNGPVFVESLIDTNVTALTVAPSPTGGTNTLVLDGANTYTGTTTIGGTLVLGATGSIAESTNIVINQGGIFDVSTQAHFALAPGQTLTALGAGTDIGTTAATLIGAAGGTVNFGSSPIILTFDGSNPALYVAQGTLILDNNPFTITTGPLNDGSYVIATAVDGITGTGPFSVTGLANGATGVITIVGNQLVLTVTNPVTTYPGGSNSLPTGNTPVNGVVFNDPTGTTLTGGANSTLSIGDSGINVAPGTGPVVIGDANGNPAVDLIGSQSWTNNSAATVTVNSPISNETTAPATLTLAGTNGFDLNGPVADGNGPLAVVQNGTGTTTLSPSNSYSGGTFVNSGTVASGDAASAGSVNNAFGSNPWVILGDDQPDTNSAALSLGTGVLTNGIVLGAGSTGDLTVGVQSNAEATVTGGIIGTNDVILSGAPGGTLTFVDGSINNHGSVTVASNPANGATGPVIVESVIDTNVTAVTVAASPIGGTNTLVLDGVNTYTGTTTIGGTLVLGATGSIADSTNIVINQGGIFDVSAHINFALQPDQTLTALGAGTGVGTTAATVTGAAGGTVNLGSSPITLNYDGSNPALYVAQGTLVLNNNPFTINAGLLNDGSYVIATSASAITGTGPFSVTGLANGATGVITIVGNQLVLTVTNPTTTYSGGTNSLPNGNTPVNGVVFNDPTGTTVTGDTNSTLSIGDGGINVAPGTGPVVIGDINGNPAVDLIGSQTWTNNGAAPVTVNSPVSNETTNPATLTLTGTNGFDLNGPVTDGNGPLAVVQDGTGTTTLSPSNSYSGGTFVNSGTVASGDAASAGSVNNAFGSNPWVTLGDDQPNTNSAALSLGTGVVTNGIVLASGSTGDLIVGVQSNAEATVTGGIIGTNDVTLSGASGGTLTFTDGSINNHGSVTVAGNGPVIIESLIDTNVTALTVAPSPAGGTNTLTLDGANTYTGTTTVGGTLVLGVTGSIADSTNIVINEGGIFDVSAHINFALQPGQTLTALGAGTDVGTTAATIIGASGGTVNLGSSPIHLTFDGSNPALYVAQGTLALNNNPFTITAGPLNDGSYVIATAVDGITGTGPFSVTGLANGATGVITIVGNQLVLTVTNPITTYPGGTNSVPTGNTPVNGIVFNDPSNTTVTGGTNSTLSIGDGGITVAPGSGPVVIGNTNGSPALNLVSDQTWTNNSTAPVTVNSPTSNGMTNPATLTLTGTNGFDFAGPVTDGNGPLSVVQDNAGTTTLSPSNDFSGGVFVKRGTVATANAASPASENAAFGSNPWVTLGDDAPNTNSAALSLGTGTVTNGILLAAGSTGDLIVSVQSNADATVTGGISGTNDVILSGAPGGTLRFTEAAINNHGSVTVSNNPADGATGPVVIESPIGSNVTSLTVAASPAGGTNELILGGVNTYTGTTRIAGRLTLEATGSISESTNIVIDQGGVFDVSSQAHFALAPGQALTSLGAGTGVGTTAATIIGAAGGTVDLGTNAVNLTFDGSNPALYVAQGTLVLNNNPFTLNVGVLTNGDYVIAESADGITGTGPFTVTGLADGATGVITIVGNQLILTVSNLAPVLTPMAIPVPEGVSLKLVVSSLATNWVDPNNSVMSLLNVTVTSTLGKTVTLSGNTIFYPKTTGNDTITYTVRNALGATNVGVINIVLTPLNGQASPTIVFAGGQATVSFAGIPGFTYYVQRTASLTPANWTTVSTNTTPAGGLFHYVDVNPPQPTAFYRLSTAP